ncbi:MAG: hypothetical protein JRI23_33615 [Deltaproteobacteria bacterium]|jgi:hypothetical protein|nr:hypothetical protein [Deltaproteobacteria bacterium]MBW2537220.1 hypothetical protein [Deltaproteobacteria bacterium]
MTRYHLPVHLLAATLATAALAGGCEQDRSAPSPRPTPSSSAASQRPCEAKPALADPNNAQYLPKAVGGFCLDPTGSDRSYGEQSKTPIADICEVIDGDCEIYKQHDVQRVVEIRYVDGRGTSATIDLYLSKFSSRDKAYAMFTKRVVGDGDPAHPDAHRPIDGGGAAALGIGNAYVWRGQFLGEMTLNDGTASTDALRKRADELLPKLVADLGAKLPGGLDLPPAAAALPKGDMLPLGVRFVSDAVLGVADTGPGAIGYYRRGDLRWRQLRITRDDDDQARDVLATFAKSKGASPDEELGDDAVRVMQQTGPGSPQAEWIVIRKGGSLLGIGDEFLVLRDGMTPAEHRKRTLSQEDKRKRLKALLGGPAPEN